MFAPVDPAAWAVLADESNEDRSNFLLIGDLPASTFLSSVCADLQECQNGERQGSSLTLSLTLSHEAGPPLLHCSRTILSLCQPRRSLYFTLS